MDLQGIKDKIKLQVNEIAAKAVKKVKRNRKIAI